MSFYKILDIIIETSPIKAKLLRLWRYSVSKPNYFNLNEDFNELKNAHLNKEKIVAGGKILVKGIVNLGIFAIKEMPVEAARQVLRNNKATPEQKERAQQIIDRYNQE